MRHRNFDHLFNSIFSMYEPINPWGSSLSSPVPSKDEDESHTINYTNDGAYCFFEVPGFNKTNLKVEIENGTIEIEGKRTSKFNGEEKTTSVSHRFRIGEGYNPDLLEATIEDGILTLFVPNMKKPEPRKRVSLL